jgi:hypothetical protein
VVNPNEALVARQSKTVVEDADRSDVLGDGAGVPLITGALAGIRPLAAKENQNRPPVRKASAIVPLIGTPVACSSQSHCPPGFTSRKTSRLEPSTIKS